MAIKIYGGVQLVMANLNAAYIETGELEKADSLTSDLHSMKSSGKPDCAGKIKIRHNALSTWRLPGSIFSPENSE